MNNNKICFFTFAFVMIFLVLLAISRTARCNHYHEVKSYWKKRENRSESYSVLDAHEYCT